MIVDNGSARRHSVDLGALLEATSTTTSSSDDVVDLAAQRATRSTLRTRNQQTRRRLTESDRRPPFPVRDIQGGDRAWITPISAGSRQRDPVIGRPEPVRRVSCERSRRVRG